MPPPSPQYLLPHILQIMPRNPKYDQFQPKGHHNMENSQSTTKMPGNPKFYPFHEVKIASKLEKLSNCNHNLISSESGQDTSACIISGHFLNGFSRKCLDPQIWPVSLSKKTPKLEKSPDRNHNLISFVGGQDTAAYHISGHSLHAFSRKCPETPNLSRFTKSK